MSGRPAALVITQGGGHDRSALAAVRALATGGYRPVLGVAGSSSLAAASRHVSTLVPMPPTTDSQFPEAVSECVAEHGSVATFPSTDAALIAMEPSLARLVDKSLLALAAPEAGLRVPATTTFSSARELMEAGPAVSYPAVVKPVFKVPGVPAYTAWTSKEVQVNSHSGPVVAQPYLDGVTEAIAGVIWSGRVIAQLQQRYARTWPRHCGTASYARVIPVDQELTTALERLMARYDGIFQAQFVAGALVDLNLRVYGSMPLALAAGLNLPAAVCGMLTGKPVDPVVQAPGTAYRWLEGDLRSVWQGFRTKDLPLGDAMRAFAPRRGTSHSVFSASDLKPAMVRLNYAAAKRKADE